MVNSDDYLKMENWEKDWCIEIESIDTHYTVEELINVLKEFSNDTPLYINTGIPYGSALLSSISIEPDGTLTLTVKDKED